MWMHCRWLLCYCNLRNNKVQTPKNVNDLKSALQVAMQKGNTNTSSTSLISSQNNIVKESNNIVTDKSDVKTSITPKEVPEEVLKNILKVE